MSASNIDLSDEKLMNAYKKFVAMPPKNEDPRLKAIQVLEPAIREMIDNKYSLRDICKNLNDELQIKISAPTLSSYLEKIEVNREESLLAAKQKAAQAKLEASKIKLEAAKVKREATKLAKAAAAIAHQIPDNGKVLESTQLSEAVTSQAVELIPDAISSSTINQKSSDIIESVVPKSVKSSKVKPIAVTTEVEILPVNIQAQAIDSDSDAETLAKEKAEAKRLRDERMDKHYNKY